MKEPRTGTVAMKSMLQLEEKLGLLLKVTACLYLLSVRWSPHQDAIVIHARLLVMTIRPVLYYRRYGASRLELNLNTVWREVEVRRRLDSGLNICLSNKIIESE